MKFEEYVEQRCKEIALRSTYKVKHGCIITYSNAIIAEACNINDLNPFTDIYSNKVKPLHAEALAIMRSYRKHYKILHNAEVYVCRVLPNGELSMSRPCSMCETILKSFKIYQVNYTNAYGNWVKETYRH